MSGIEMSAGSDTDDYVECHNFHSNPTYDSTSNSKHKAEEITRSNHEDSNNLQSIQSPENSPMHKLRMRMSAIPQTDYFAESGNSYVNPAYESTLNTDCKVEESVRSDYYEIDHLSHHETSSKSIQPPNNPPLNKLCVRVPAVTKNDESGNYNINPEYENVRFSDQELRVRLPAVAETDESGNYNINPAYENVRFADQELRVRTPSTHETDNFKPIYENVRSGSKELERLSHLEMIRKRIQLPERGPKRNSCARRPLGPRKDDSGDCFNCHINLAYESTMDFNYKVGENVRLDNQELKLDSHREMIRKSIQLPERGHKREPRPKMVVSKTDGSGGSDNYHINLACESTSNINRIGGGKVESADQELDRLSYREMIRRSIQLPESNSKRKNRRCCSLLDRDHKEERLLVAYLLLVALFVMTFGSIALTIIIRIIPLKFFPNSWMLTIALASLCCLIGVYICWQGEICKSPRPQQEEIFIGMELTTFEEN